MFTATLSCLCRRPIWKTCRMQSDESLSERANQHWRLCLKSLQFRHWFVDYFFFNAILGILVSHRTEICLNWQTHWLQMQASSGFFSKKMSDFTIYIYIYSNYSHGGLMSLSWWISLKLPILEIPSIKYILLSFNHYISLKLQKIWCSSVIVISLS